MTKKRKTRKQNTSEEVEIHDSEHNPRDRITHQLLLQLKPHLPIKSFKNIAKELDEVVVDKHRVPLKLFASHISNDLFPIETIEDLEQKLSDGVRRTVSLANSGIIPVGNKVFIKILATTFQEQDGNLMPRVTARNIYSPASASESTAKKGGK